MTVDGVRAVGGQLARINNRVVIAVPVVLPSSSESTGYWIAPADGGHFDFGNGRLLKHRLTSGCGDGILATQAFHDALREKRSLAGVEVFRFEGEPDLIAASSQDTELLGWTNKSGANENPKQYMLDAFAACKIDRMSVIHDCDKPGQEGAIKWAKALAGVIPDVRNVVLPYTVENDHGKDVRDYIIDGHSLDDLKTLSAKATPVASDDDEIELLADELGTVRCVIDQLAKDPNLYQRNHSLVEVISAQLRAHRAQVSHSR